MSLITALTGSPRNGILAIILFFIAGALILTRVDVAAGERAAREAELDAGVLSS